MLHRQTSILKRSPIRIRAVVGLAAALWALMPLGAHAAPRGPTFAGKPASLGKYVYFPGSVAAHGRELWRSDGTVVGTEMVADVRPGSASSELEMVRTGATQLFFRADDGTHGTELGVSDGTAAGTRILDLYPGATGSRPVEIVTDGDVAYFRAEAPGAGFQLWRSDGTDAGTGVLVETVPLSAHAFTPAGGLLYFIADDGSHGREVWVSDGTTAGTRMLADVRPGPGAGASTAAAVRTSFVELDGLVYFSADDGVNGPELWRTDGTEAGTELFHQFDATPGRGGRPLMLAAKDGIAVFSVSLGEPAGAPALWRTDGTGAGTFPIAPVGPASGGGTLAFAGERLFFVAGRTQLWTSNLSPGGASLLRDIATPGCLPRHYFGDLTPLADDLFLVGRQARSDEEPWTSDGTPAGTKRLKNIHPTHASVPRGLTAHEGALYFSANPIDRGRLERELWRSDGTETGTNRVECCSTRCSSGVDADGDRLVDACVPTESKMRVEEALARFVATGRPRARLRVRAAFDTSPLGFDAADGVTVSVRDGGSFHWEMAFAPEDCRQVGGRTRCDSPSQTGTGAASVRFRPGAPGETGMRLAVRRLDVPLPLTGPLRVDVLHGGVRHRVGAASSCTVGPRSLHCG